MTILIAQSAGFSPLALQRLRERAQVIEGDLDRSGLLAAVPAADVLWVRLRHRIDDEVLRRAMRSRRSLSPTPPGHAYRRGRGATTEHPCAVLARRGGVSPQTVRATAELTLGLILALVRRLPAAAAHVTAGGWDRDGFKGRDLYEKTAGIVGLGRLGRIVVDYLQALGMHVLATTPEPEPAPGVIFVPLEELLRRAM